MMNTKRLYILIILLSGVELLVQANSLQYANVSQDFTTADKQLAAFYDTNSNLLAGKILNSMESFTEQILQDPIVQQSATPLINNFSRNMADFLEIYPFYKRFGLNKSLAVTFFETVNDFNATNLNNDQDFLYIQQLIGRFGFSEIQEEFTKLMENFVFETFLPKFEHLRDQIADKEQLSMFNDKYLVCIHNLKKCLNYECYLNGFRNLFLTPKDQFIGKVHGSFLTKSILLFKNITTADNEFLNNLKFQDLNPAITQPLSQNMQNFTVLPNKADKPYDFIVSVSLHPLFIISVKYNSTTISKKDFETLENIGKNYEHFSFEYISEKMNQLILDIDFLKEIEKLKASMSETELQNEKSLISTLSQIERASSRKEKLRLLKDLDIFKEDDFQNWRI